MCALDSSSSRRLRATRTRADTAAFPHQTAKVTDTDTASAGGPALAVAPTTVAFSAASVASPLPQTLRRFSLLYYQNTKHEEISKLRKSARALVTPLLLEVVRGNH